MLKYYALAKGEDGEWETTAFDSWFDAVASARECLLDSGVTEEELAEDPSVNAEDWVVSSEECPDPDRIRW